MPDPLRDIVLDFREAILPTGVPRRIDVTPVPGKATVCIGPRRAGSRMLVQVCESLAEPRTRKREVKALERAMDELGLRAGTIVTREQEETLPVDAGSIEVLPAWRFLLDLG